MGADIQEQEDELLALHSIFGSDEFLRDESKFAGELRVCVELPSAFTVALKEGETLSQYEISFLPPLLLTFGLPEDYPSSSPPSFTLTCSWLTHSQLSALSAQLTDLFKATRGAVVLFSWVQFLKEDALRFLDINTLLELPSGDSSTQNCSQDSLDVALSKPKNNKHTPTTAPADTQSLDLSALALEAEQTLQTSEIKAGCQDDQPKQTSQEDFLNEGSVLLPSSSSGPPDESKQGAAALPREPPQNGDQTLSGFSLTPSQALLSQILIYDAAQQQKQFAATVFDCGVCFQGFLGLDCVQLPECGHIFCRACLSHFCKLQIREGSVQGVTCPEADCEAAPTPAQVKSLVGEELFSRYDRLLLQKTLDCMPDVVYCPRHSCGSPVIWDRSGTAAMCTVCAFAFCVICKKTYHGTEACQGKKKIVTENDAQQPTAGLPQSEEGLKALWDDYTSGSKQRKKLLESRYGRKTLLGGVVDCLSEGWVAINSKNCPCCFSRIQKDGGCNVMMCSRCGRMFCWSCLTKLSSHGDGHFDDGACTRYT
ncbi:E3 ubiquitin-protein ligase RNF14-like isoform X2 [Acanthopagrus latus]|uniref:E3 ubiquitin-protein ligase RNF14-like isoform X2 n=1 Tax=Acanthopagrus latus TaxID=8177 RepID=UPI00187C8DED|nr:E3 ubiquitin-protein ligase RNF14-like isoform X2 [Acanthopagrus latus]